MTSDFGINQGLVDELYASYLENPQLVDESWRRYFDGLTRTERGAKGPGANGNGAQGHFVREPASPHGHAGSATATSLTARVQKLVNAYRTVGHLVANINPLGDAPALSHELEPASYGIGPEELSSRVSGVDVDGSESMTVADVIGLMRATYCGSIGVEFRSIENGEERRWLQSRMEATANRMQLDRAMQVHLLTKLSDAENFEQFIHSSYAPGTKRFSLEGLESLIPMLDLMIERGAELGVEEVVFGMAHRGRLNVLVNTLEMRLSEIFYAFEDKDAERYLGRGDVKYHLGFSNDRVTTSGKRVHLTMTFNPSHLEFVNPVVEGRVRAKQDRRRDGERKTIVPMLIHGDAAFVGQGVNTETLNMCGLPSYATGGTIHVIVNNQVGFTTDPSDSRSTHYASDIMKMLNVPVFHVNGEDPEAVAQVAHLAMEWRQRFQKDVLIDLYGYRRYGHNEGDEPRFTQPKMYRIIDKKPTVREMYVRRLVELGQIDTTTADEIGARRRHALSEALDEVKKKGFVPAPDTMGGVWQGYAGGSDAEAPEAVTAVARETLVALAEASNRLPDGFQAHKKVAAVLQQRHQRVAAGEPFDWGTAETLAYATLLAEGSDIRISGEDVHRGTFSHRHAVVFDQETGKGYVPLNHMRPQQGRYESCNSPLSEQSVLGFDFGYSLDSPDKLVIWEAQFGDFLNVAQVIVDQFICSSEDKWMRLSGLVLYLPHGYEGQGPEHSSARIERFLQSAAEDNIQVVNLTTPAQLFHVLRRQIVRKYRKPLVIFTPKSLLRAAYGAEGPKPVSTLDDLATGRFHRVLADDVVDPKKVRKVLLCSGKVYYDLAKRRHDERIEDVAIVRLEQLYPFNGELTEALAPYADGTPLVWVQEEPWNNGPWFYIQATLPKLLGGRLPLVDVVSRDPSASPATGSKAAHNLEQARILEQAFAR
jgi:2-oxoglutarate dehydrogenase E1 component